VTVSVEDADRTRLPHLVSPRSRGEHGHGLRIVELLSQSWGVSTDPEDAKVVWASFAVGRAPVGVRPPRGAIGGERAPVVRGGAAGARWERDRWQNEKAP
jgi:hypothetical protein